MPAIAVIPKRVNEKFEIELQYQPPDILASENISNCETTASNGLNQTDNSATVTGNNVSQWIWGGVSGNEYTLTFKTTIDSGRILEHYVIIDVDD